MADPYDVRDPIPREELINMTPQPPEFRKPFANKEDKKKAQKEALQYVEDVKCERPPSAVGKWIFNVTSTECGEASHSPGIELYMKWLAQGGFLLFFWSGLVFGLIIANAAPSDSDEELSVGFLAILSLGSFGEANDPRPWNEREMEIMGEYYNMSEMTPLFGTLGAIGAAMFTNWIFWFKFSFVRRLKRKKFETMALPSHYTVMIEYLPKLAVVKELGKSKGDGRGEGTEFYERELREHLKNVLVAARKKKADFAAKMRAKEKNPSDEPLPEATGEENIDILFPSIGFARDNDGELGREMEEARLKEQIAEGLIDVDEKKLEKCRKQAEKIVKKQHGEHDLPESEKEVFRAFVMIDRAKDCDLLVEEYRMSEFVLGYYFQPKNLRFAGGKIMLRRAPEPSNLMWENLDAPYLELWIRQRVVEFAVFVMLCFSGYLISLAKLKQKAAQDASSTDDCPVKDLRMFPVDNTNQGVENWNPPTLVEMLAKPGTELLALAASGAAAVVNKASALIYLNQKLGEGVMPVEDSFSDCYCSAIGFAGLAGQNRLKTACRTFYDLQVEILTITIGSAIGVVVMNAILKFVLISLARFERAGTVSEMTISLAFKIFFCQFLNTAAVVYVLNSKFFGPIFDGDYNDFNHKWYATVGLALCTAMMAGMVTPHFPQAIMIPIVTKIKRTILGSWLAKNKADVFAAYEPPEYDLPTKAGMLLNTLFVCIIFGSGMPILIPFATVAMLGACVCDKHLVINICKKPPAYDEVVLDKTAGIMLFAMLLHAGIAVCMLGEPDVFPSSHFLTFQVPNVSFLSPLVVIWKRGWSMGAGAYFLLFLVLFIYFFMQFLTLLFGDAFTAFAVGVESLFCSSCKKRRKYKDPERKAHNMRFLEAQAEWKEDHEIATYVIADNPKYAVMKASDVDLEYWVQTNILARMLTTEQWAELEKKRKAGAPLPTPSKEVPPETNGAEATNGSAEKKDGENKNEGGDAAAGEGEKKEGEGDAPADAPAATE